VSIAEYTTTIAVKLVAALITSLFAPAPVWVGVACGLTGATVKPKLGGVKFIDTTLLLFGFGCGVVNATPVGALGGIQKLYAVEAVPVVLLVYLGDKVTKYLVPGEKL
jgi:hypothetical protein